MPGIIDLSRAASIGIHACALLHRSDKRMNASQIAEILNASTHHVAKVLQKLAGEGILNSTKGASGGFSLTIDPKSVSLLKIYEIIQGPIENSHCPEYAEECPFPECVWGDFGTQTRESFREYLKNRSLADVKSTKDS